MIIDPIMLEQLKGMAAGIRNQVKNQGRPMLAEEQAAMMLCFALQEASKWLESTLHDSAEERLFKAMGLRQLYLDMLEQ